LALYAALARAGAEIPADAPSADRAAALAKRILLAWSTHGFQDGHGHFRTAAQFSINPGLQISRGLVYSVQTQDLLMYLGDLSRGEVQQVNAFHGAMYELMRTSHNEGVNYFLSTEVPDQVYSNGFANQLASLLAMARLFDDQNRFDAALYGGEGNDAVRMPWIMFFNHVIYGVSDTPLRPIALKVNADPPTGPDYTTAIVAAGEINDRYRNGNAGQGIGYPMFTLERLINAAEIIRVAGLDPYGYRGLHKQSVEMAIAYYACFAKGAGYLKVVTAENAGSCPNAPQYYGKIVNDVDRMVQFGAYRFPNNTAITDVEAPAKKFALEAATTFSTDAILFGKWRD
jgi:hypothetical protein